VIFAVISSLANPRGPRNPFVYFRLRAARRDAAQHFPVRVAASESYAGAFAKKLFVSQCHDGIDTGGPARGNVASKQSDGHQQTSNAGKSERVGGADAKK